MRISLLITALLLAFPVHAQVSANHGKGSIILGNDTGACDTDRQGALRYTGSQLQVCYGAGSWTALPDASGTVPGLTGDRITSGTAGVFISNTGVINFRTGGVTTGYFDASGLLVAPGVSITTGHGISSTFGTFSKEVKVGSSGTTCTSGNSGAIRYVSTTLAYCDGSSWHAIFGEGSDPAGFAFTDQLSVNASTLVTSDAVNLGSFAGTLTATCTGCSAVARNGVWGGTTLGGFTSGDAITLRLTSSGNYNTAVVATVTVGSKTSNPWTVRTASLNGPDPFAFTNITGAATNWTYASDAVTLTGFTGALTATCTGCNAIARNGVWTGGTRLDGFTAGDSITIRQTSSAVTGATTQADVTVGSTTSSAWTLTTSTACQAGITAGQECPDGTIYAGTSPDGNVPMYTTRCDAGQTWDGSTCTGTRSTMAWCPGTGTTTSYTSVITGKSNSLALATLLDACAPYPAAQFCENLVDLGHADWYLPATQELQIMSQNSPAIGNFIDATYQSSSEVSTFTNTSVNPINIATNVSGNKGITRYVRCIRR